MTAVDVAQPAAAMPGPRRVTPGMLRTLASQPPLFFAAMRERYGDAVRVSLGGKTMYLVSHPADIQDVLVTSNRFFGNDILRDGAGGREPPLAKLLGKGLLTSDGEHHRRQRRLIQPLFHRQRVAGYASAFAELAAARAAAWTDGARLDVLTEMVELTLSVVARTVFDVSLDSSVATTIRTALPRNDGPLRWALMPAGRLLASLPLPENIAFRRGKAALDQVVYQLIAQRRATGATGRDLLSLLLTVRDADTGEPMDDQQVRDEALTLLMAGHDTTANALAWAFHLLGGDPVARRRLQREVDEVLGDRPPQVSDLPRLTWTQAVLSEALRLYPPVWTVGRRPLAERVVAGYRLPADSMVMMSPWVVHHDPRWWPEPERFAPQRWVEAAPDATVDALTGTALRDDLPKFAYFPFGGGPRQCIGNNFAQMEGVIALAEINRRWELRPVPGASVRPQARIIVRPRPGLPMTAHRRRGGTSPPRATGR